jgi:hypothetical protein
MFREVRDFLTKWEQVQIVVHCPVAGPLACLKPKSQHIENKVPILMPSMAVELR